MAASLRLEPDPRARVIPQSADAEDAVLGAMLISAEAIQTAAGLLEPGDFYRESNGRIFRAALDLHDAGAPVDAITLTDALEAAGALEDVGGRARVHELAALVPTTKNVAHYAGIVREKAALRALVRAGSKLAEIGYDEGDALAGIGRASELVRELVDRQRGNERFVGLSHVEALARKVSPTRTLVESVVEAGTPGTIAGLPETHKSALANELAHKVAAGGCLLGRYQVLTTGPVAYYWQDDSEANELWRLQGYARRHGYTGNLPIRWHLNEGLVLPKDLAVLRLEAERDGLVLIVLDSFYNFLPATIGLADQDVGHLVGRLKDELCNQTGVAVCVVDHAAWPTEGNKGQRRGYGSVFKAAAFRWGVYLDRDGDHLYLEARGNNISGIKRTAVVWNPDTLELRLAEASPKEQTLADAIADFLKRYRGATTTVVRAGVKGTDAAIDAELRDNDRFVSVSPVLFGKPRNATCWALKEDVSDLFDRTSAENAADVAPTSREEHADIVGGTHPPDPGGVRGATPTLGSTPAAGDADVGEEAS